MLIECSLARKPLFPFLALALFCAPARAELIASAGINAEVGRPLLASADRPDTDKIESMAERLPEPEAPESGFFVAIEGGIVNINSAAVSGLSTSVMGFTAGWMSAHLLSIDLMGAFAIPRTLPVNLAVPGGTFPGSLAVRGEHFGLTISQALPIAIGGGMFLCPRASLGLDYSSMEADLSSAAIGNFSQSITRYDFLASAGLVFQITPGIGVTASYGHSLRSFGKQTMTGKINSENAAPIQSSQSLSGTSGGMLALGAIYRLSAHFMLGARYSQTVVSPFGTQPPGPDSGINGSMSQYIGSVAYGF